MQALEGDERADQRTGLARFDTRRQQEEERVEVVLLRDDLIFPQILRDDRRRHAMLRIGPRPPVETRGQQRQLVRIGHGIAGHHMAEAVPGGAGRQLPEARVGREGRSVGTLSQGTSDGRSSPSPGSIDTVSATEGDRRTSVWKDPAPGSRTRCGWRGIFLRNSIPEPHRIVPTA